jgi:VWFA-related protein
MPPPVWTLARAGALLAGLMLVVEIPDARQAPPQTAFRLGVDLVDVDVSVLDEYRMPVRGLTAGDFTVLENGRPRPIVLFAPVDLLPRVLAPAAWMDQVAPDVASNQFAREGRLVVIMMDRTIAVVERPVARDIAVAAIGQLGPGDLAAVVFATHGVPQNFTADRQRLLAAVERPFAILPDGDAGGPARCYCGSCSLETVATVAEGLKDVKERRKILIIIGNNMAIAPGGTCSGALSLVRDRALRALRASNVTVHQFDPSGLDVVHPGATSAEPPDYARLVAAAMRRRGNLGVLPGETGGRLVTHNAPARDVGAVFRESASYYVLGFSPADGRADGRFRDIKVRVNRPNTTLQARRGYYPPGGKPPDLLTSTANLGATLSGALAGVWPRTDLAMTLQAVPLALPGLREAEVRLVVGVRHDGAGPPWASASLAGAPASTTADLYVGAFDRNGKSLAGARERLTVPGVPAAGGAMAYEVFARLPVKPGRYEVRAAIDDDRARASGAVYGYVDVPNFAAEPVSLSGIFLSAAPVSGVPRRPAANDLLPVVPTARREFARTERVTAFVREHQGLTRALMPGYLTIEIRSAADARVFGQEIRIVPDQFGGNRAMDYAFDLPLGSLAPGEYLLSVDARHGTITARRDARFVVR